MSLPTLGATTAVIAPLSPQKTFFLWEVSLGSASLRGQQLLRASGFPLLPKVSLCSRAPPLHHDFHYNPGRPASKMAEGSLVNWQEWEVADEYMTKSLRAQMLSGLSKSLGNKHSKVRGSSACDSSRESISPLASNYRLNLWASFVRDSGGPHSSGQKMEKICLDTPLLYTPRDLTEEWEPFGHCP